jgi:hypothetical protein
MVWVCMWFLSYAWLMSSVFVTGPIRRQAQAARLWQDKCPAVGSVMGRLALDISGR